MLAGAAIGAGASLAYQLYENHGNIKCVNWGDVANCAMLGAALGSGWGELGAMAEEAGAATEVADEAAAAGNSAADDACETGCFVAGTLIEMANGTTKRIESVKVGDVVLSRDPKTGKTEAKKVIRTYVHYHRKTLTLKLADGDTFVVTPNHPFYVKGKSFVSADHLSIGAVIVTKSSTTTVSENTNNTGDATVYNFEVQQDHTYFVGVANGGAWVHIIFAAITHSTMGLMWTAL